MHVACLCIMYLPARQEECLWAKSGCLDPAGHAWETEYGDPDNETDFKYLMTYSPLHNVRVPAGSHQHPPTMLTTGRRLLSYAFH